jgi:hypothetical protein
MARPLAVDHAYVQRVVMLQTMPPRTEFFDLTGLFMAGPSAAVVMKTL